MNNDTSLGMGMVLVGAIVLIVYFTLESRKRKKIGKENISEFLKNAISISETISPETNGMGLALVRFSYDLKTSGMKLGKEMTKEFTKGMITGALTGLARVKVAVPNAGCDYYIVRYGHDDMYFFQYRS